MSGIARQRRRGTTSQHQVFTGLQGELTVDTTIWSVRVHDGITAGGWPLAALVHGHSDATTMADGFMSASDKLKLGNLPTTVSYQTVMSNLAVKPQRGNLSFTSAFAVSDDSASNRTIVDVAPTGVTPGQFTKVTVNALGQVITGALLTVADIPALPASKISDLPSILQNTPLSTFAAPIRAITMAGQHLTDLPLPNLSTDAASKQYVDAVTAGLNFKQACRAATVANIALTIPGSMIDGVTLVNGDRILVKNQSNAPDNGIYTFSGAAMPLQRASDANSNGDIQPGMFTWVQEGTVNGNIAFVLATEGTIAIGTTALSFVIFSASASNLSAGNGLTESGNVLSVHTVSSNRITVDVNGVDLNQIASAGTYTSVTVDQYGRVTSGTSVAAQPASAALAAIGAVASNGLMARTGSNTYAARSLSAGTGISIANSDGSAGNPSIAVNPDSVNEQVRISHNGILVGTRCEFNLVDGENTTLTVADDSTNNRVNVTVASADGGGSFNGVFTQATAPASSTLAASEFLFYLDPTPGAVVLHVMAKDSAGTVVDKAITLS